MAKREIMTNKETTAIIMMLTSQFLLELNDELKETDHYRGAVKIHAKPFIRALKVEMSDVVENLYIHDSETSQNVNELIDLVMSKIAKLGVEELIDLNLFLEKD